MNRKSLKVNSILNAVRMLLTVLVPLITFPYTSRIFMTDGNGEISFVQSVVQIFTLFASLGIYSYGLREGTKVRNNKKEFSKLVLEIFLINLVTTILTYVVFIISINLYSPFVSTKWLFLINGISIGFTALGLDWVFGVYEDYIYITLRQIMIQIFVVIGMLIFVHTEDDIFIWMTILTISSVGSNIFNFLYARKYVDYKWIITSKTKPAIKRHIKPIIILFSTTLAAKVYSNVDTILLGIQTSSHNVGLYTAAVKMNSILITMFSAMSPVFMPRLTQHINKGDIGNYYILISKIFRMIISVCIPTVIGLEMISGEIISVLAGPAFMDAVITMRILSPIVLICSCSNILYYNVLIPVGKENYVLNCTLINAVVNLIISLILIPFFKENGATVGSLISEIIALVVALLYCKKVDKHIFDIIPQIFNYVLGGVGVVLCCLATRYVFKNEILILIVSVMSSIVAYVLILYLRSDEMTDEGINMLRNLYKKFSER